MRRLAHILVFLLCLAFAQGAQLSIGLGKAANDGTGDTLRTAGGKINTNFTYLFGLLTNTCYINAGDDITVRFAGSDASLGTISLGPGLYQVAGIYRTNLQDVTNAPLKLPARTNLVIRGYGNAVIHSTNGGPIILAMWAGCSNVLFDGIVFRGTRTNGTTYSFPPTSVIGGLVSTYGTNNNITFLNCRFEDTDQFGLAAGTFEAPTEVLTINLRVQGGGFYRCGHTNWNGIPHDGGAGAIHGNGHFEQVQFERCGRGFEPFAQAGGLSDYDLTFRGCWFKDMWGNCVFSQSGVSAVGVVVDNCYFSFDKNAREAFGQIFECGPVRHLRIRACTITNLPSNNSVVQNIPTAGTAQDFAFEDNFVSHSYNGLVVRAQRGVIIARNTFQYVTNRTLELSGSEVLVTGNTFRDCGLDGTTESAPVGCGYFSLNATNVQVFGNTFIRTLTTGPMSFVKFDATCFGGTIGDNTYANYAGGNFTNIIDNGVNTRRTDFPQLKARTIDGAGSGLTNFTLSALDALQWVGNSNVNIAAFMGYEPSVMRRTTVLVTNLSPIIWGIGFPQTTNRYRYLNLQTGTTNGPTFLTNNSLLRLECEITDTNVFIRHQTQSWP